MSGGGCFPWSFPFSRHQGDGNDENLMISKSIKDHSGDVCESPGIAWSEFWSIRMLFDNFQKSWKLASKWRLRTPNDHVRTQNLCAGAQWGGPGRPLRVHCAPGLSRSSFMFVLHRGCILFINFLPIAFRASGWFGMVLVKYCYFLLLVARSCILIELLLINPGWF